MDALYCFAAFEVICKYRNEQDVSADSHLELPVPLLVPVGRHRQPVCNHQQALLRGVGHAVAVRRHVRHRGARLPGALSCLCGGQR